MLRRVARRNIRSRGPTRPPLRLQPLEDRTVPALRVWAGDVNANWGTNSGGNTNWSGDVLPVNGDDLIFPFLELGGVGGVCVHTHVVGPQVKEMVRRYRGGDVDGARRIDEELRPAIELLRVTTNPIAIKAALNLIGRDVGGLRLPLVSATDDEVARIRDCLERAGVLATV